MKRIVLKKYTSKKYNLFNILTYRTQGHVAYVAEEFYSETDAIAEVLTPFNVYLFHINSEDNAIPQL